MKYAGPTKKMMKALEDEGLTVAWPKTGNVNDEELLAIDATFYTGCDWEKCVLIDLRNMSDLGSKAGVDSAIASQLQEAYDNFDIDDEMRMHLESHIDGRPDSERLLEDMKEQDFCLKRFAEVANAVSEGRPIPPKEVEAKDGETVHITPQTAQMIVDYLRILYKDMNTLGKDDFVLIGNELCRKMGKPLVKWGK